jgi:catechol 2,3-dioxygenase-like lactoylglutathione lyase family enzyme
MLTDKSTYTTIPVSDLDRARRFYEETLGVKPSMVTEGGVMFTSGSSRFFVYPSAFKASGHTQMSWVVDNIQAEVVALKAKGIEFEEFEVPGVETVGGVSEVGPNVWTAYFRDPDGNLLLLTQIGEAEVSAKPSSRRSAPRSAGRARGSGRAASR